MADKVITRIRTNEGNLQIDYNSLYGKPEPKELTDISIVTGDFADAKSVVTELKNIKNNMSGSNFVPTSRKINGHALTSDITLTAVDLGLSETDKEYSADDITSGTLPIVRGGTGAANGQDGLKNLLAAGSMILSYNQYDTSLPPIPTTAEERNAMRGRIFFVKV